jgi:heptosyltransferase-3
MITAIVPARGIGDALIFTIAAHHFFQKGDEVTLYHDQIGSLREWFPHCRFAQADDPRLLQSERIILQNDNSERMKRLHAQAQIFYPSYEPMKHPPLRPGDHLFDASEPMAHNLALIFGSDETGIVPPDSLQFRKHPKRIALHPLSALPSKNWCAQKYRALASELRQRGYDPQFIVSPGERPLFPEAPHFVSLSDAAAFLYESGGFIGNDSAFGHLASLFGHHPLTIGGNHKLLRLWRPGWSPGTLITPPSWIPNVKGLRLRETRWQSFITVRRVLNNYLKINSN